MENQYAKKNGMSIAALITALLMIAMLTAACSSKTDDRISIKVLLLPKFEIEKMTGDFPGEAQYYYEEYLADSDVYEISGTEGDGKLYVKDGIAHFRNRKGHY